MAPAHEEGFSLPSPPALAPPSLTVKGWSADAFATLFEALPSEVAEVARVLAAHQIAAAASFQDLLCLDSLAGVERHAYQIETVRRVLRVLRGRGLLADEVGLGKTIEGIMVLREYQLRGMARRTLVLVPPSLVGQWMGELAAKAGVRAISTDDAQLRLRPDDLWDHEGVIVASLALARGATHAAAIQARSWDLVMVDEAHRIKNRTTLGWKLLNGIRSRFLLLLTATPVETDLEELYNLVTLLKPGQFPTPAAFRKEFIDPKEPTSPRNRDRLRALLGEVMVRNTRATCGLKLPPRFVTTVVVDPLPKEDALYQSVLALLRTHAEDGGARRAAATLLLEAGSSPDALRATLGVMAEGNKHSPAFQADVAAIMGLAASVPSTKKVQVLLRFVRQGPDKVLVFSRYRRTLEHLSAALAAEGVSHVTFHGGLDRAEKLAAIDAFRADAQVMIATDVGSEGHNLHFCHQLVNFDLPWNPMVIEQRIGRLHRFGQEHEVVVQNLCARGTVEERILELLDKRIHLFELVVGEMDMVLGNLTDDRDFDERIVDIVATARSEDEVGRGFDTLAAELLKARGQYERARALDQALFERDFET